MAFRWTAGLLLVGPWVFAPSAAEAGVHVMIKHPHTREVPRNSAWFMRFNVGGSAIATTAIFDVECGRVALWGDGSDWQFAIGGRPEDWIALHLGVWGQGAENVSRAVDQGQVTRNVGQMGWAAIGPGITLESKHPRFWVSSSIGVAGIAGSALPYRAAVGPAWDTRIAKEWPLRRGPEGLGIYAGVSLFGLPLQSVNEPLGAEPVHVQMGAAASIGFTMTVL
jgi:hypothetical protein